MIEVTAALDITAQIVTLKERVGGGVRVKNCINRNNVAKAVCESFQSDLKIMLDKQQ